jgi:hypothetical protein
MVKRPEHEADNSLPSRVDVKNDRAIPPVPDTSQEQIYRPVYSYVLNHADENKTPVLRLLKKFREVIELHSIAS